MTLAFADGQTRAVAHSGARGTVSHAEASLPPETLARVKALGPLTIVDLRSAPERAGDAAPALAAAAVIAPHDDADSIGDPAGLVAACTVSPAATRAAIARLYTAMPDAQAVAFAAFFRALADGRTPLLLHCAVGKDRTGVAIAILLQALGAARETIAADYLASNASRPAIAAAFAADPRALAIRAAPEAVWGPMLTAEAAWLDGMFDALATRHGGARRYVERAVGPDGLARIAGHLVSR